MANSIGFIGGGRVARILLGGWQRAGQWPQAVVVADPASEALATLRASFPKVVTAPEADPAAQDVVFLAVHPPALGAALAEARGRLRADAIVVSLAPRLTVAEIGSALGGFDRVARMIPNAPSVVGAGYNPTCFGPGLAAADRERLGAVFAPLGEAPQVAERELEAWALLTGMGPTYFWFQFYELLALAEGFGLARGDAQRGLQAMVAGALRTMADSGLAPDQVTDLIPVRPLADSEAPLRAAYRERLQGLFEKIRPTVR